MPNGAAAAAAPSAGGLVRRPAPVKDAPVVDDQHLSSAPFVDVRRTERQAMLQKLQGGATALVDCFEAARIISKKRAVGRARGFVSGKVFRNRLWTQAYLPQFDA